MPLNFAQYTVCSVYDELIDASGQARPAARNLVRYLESLSDTEIAARNAAVDLAIKAMGISFTVYTEG